MKRAAWGVLVATTALMIGLLAGCSSSDQRNVDEHVQGFRQEASQAGAKVTQAARNVSLEATVKAALGAHKGLDSSKIHVDARAGDVTLSGDIPSKKQAQEAEKVAGETKGVQHVKSELTVPVPAQNMP